MVETRSLAVKILKHVVPWVITAAALIFAFKGINWVLLWQHIAGAHKGWLVLAAAIGCTSYFIRALRWQRLFPRPVLSFADSFQVLVLGFFMNNILPARAGEFIRAHFGGQKSGEKRTLVLATVFSERLADGLTISAMFILFASHLGDQGMAKNLSYVALMFAVAGLGTLLAILLRKPAEKLGDTVVNLSSNRLMHYVWERVKLFLDGLAPLFTPRMVPMLFISSVIIWFVEVLIYFCVAQAFHAPVSIPGLVLLMVAVNFSVLIPAAPGGIGVVEAVGSAALVSIGMDKEHALSMVLAVHAIQYLVVGIPGLIIMLRWRSAVRKAEEGAALA